MLEIYQELSNIVSRGERAVLATVISSRGSAPRKAGTKMLIKADGSYIGTIGGGGAELMVLEKARGVMNSGEPQTMHVDLSGREEDAAMICGGQMEVFLEPIRSAETLCLFGAGHISQSTATMGRMLGFRVVVIDPRPDYNNAERFPDAEQRLVEDYEDAFGKLDVADDGYIIISTPSHVLDEKCLRFAVGTGAKYIGMIGSKKKVKEVKERVLASGVDQAKLDTVHTPIGIEIGAETPEEIAISILAEIIQVRRNART